MNKLADLIDQDAPHLARIESTDNGKVIRETEAQMHAVARQMRFFAGYADKIYGKTIAQTEVFGPVPCVMRFRTEARP
jgi:acyl-CoA reductase-like NAD-dependent aldehyde dehydrogenase